MIIMPLGPKVSHIQSNGFRIVCNGDSNMAGVGGLHNALIAELSSRGFQASLSSTIIAVGGQTWEYADSTIPDMVAQATAGGETYRVAVEMFGTNDLSDLVDGLTPAAALARAQSHYDLLVAENVFDEIWFCEIADYQYPGENRTADVNTYNTGLHSLTGLTGVLRRTALMEDASTFGDGVHYGDPAKAQQAASIIDMLERRS